MIRYLTGSLFEAPLGTLLVHGCNGQGVWGSGIAREFRDRFPLAFDRYRRFCLERDRVGSALIVPDSGYLIGCLITSLDYGPRVDQPETILVQTRSALLDLHDQWVALDPRPPVASNRFNSGLFHVNWADTSRIITEEWPTSNPWTVYDPDISIR